jgi:hypothetical protein
VKSEEVTDDELAKLDAVVPKTSKARSKSQKRDWDTWYFGGMLQELGTCEDPECPDPRGRDQVMTSVINGKRMCRFSFIEGFGL